MTDNHDLSGKAINMWVVDFAVMKNIQSFQHGERKKQKIAVFLVSE